LDMKQALPLPENKRDVESIASALTAVLTSLSKLYGLAQECANDENIQELLESVREHARVKTSLRSLVQLIGDHEYAQLETHLHSVRTAISEDDVPLALSITLKAFDALPAFRERCHAMKRELKANGVLEAKMSAADVKAETRILADKASSVEIEARQHKFVYTMRTCGEARWERALAKIEKIIIAATSNKSNTSNKSKLKQRDKNMCAMIDVEIRKYIQRCRDMSTLLQEATHRTDGGDAFLIKCAKSGVDALARRMKSAGEFEFPSSSSLCAWRMCASLAFSQGSLRERRCAST
jgi:hypothetical protein